MKGRGIAIGALALAGCNHSVKVHGEISVPVEVQAQFTHDAPGLLVLGGGFDVNAFDVTVLAVLCDAAAQPLQIPFSQEQAGCASAGTVWFRATKITESASRAALACGPHDETFDSLMAKGWVTPDDTHDLVAAAVVPLFTQEAGPCHDGDQTVSTTLMLSTD